MVKYLASTFIAVALLLNCHIANAQIEELLEREVPQFRIAILPLGEEGIIEIEVYFSHSRLSNLEASFWMIERGDNRLNEGVQKMIAPLQRMNNREPTIIKIEGLKHNNFYAFGLDYRRISPILNTRFTTGLLQEGYQYQYISIPNNYADSKEDNIIFPTKGFSSKNVVECESPTLTLQIEAEGYCQDNAMPAVLINNARNQTWEFTIETRTKNTDWRPLLHEGKRQKAEGAVTRIEPLCLLNAGTHSLRVLAWGEGCTRPITAEIQEPIIIGSAYAYTSTEKETPSSYELPRITPTPTLPDTCIVRGKAEIVGNRLVGSVELDKYSLCGDFSPYTIIRYVNPSNRDLALEPIPLKLGKPITFEFNLEDKDLARTIHPINVVTYIRDHATKEDRMMSAFWIRSDQPKSNNNIAYSKQDNDNEIVARTYPDRPINPPVDLTTKSPLNNSTSGTLENKTNTPKSYEYGEPTIEEEMNAFNVIATDPNCTPINDLRMVYDLNRSNKPLYISWINPRCCQEDGCEYTVWSGKTPDQLSLVIKGFKPGAVIKEILDPNRTEDTYYEVVIKTKNGSRKAAYLIGEGAKYGIEEILEVHDRHKPVKSDSLKFIKTNQENANVTPKSGSGGATFKWDDDSHTSASTQPVKADINYAKPKLPITKFQPCKSQEQIQVLAKQQPIQIGDKITMQYNYDREGYKYTLYFQPQYSTEWVIAPQTQELHTKAQFTFQVDEQNTGDYKMLLYKVDKGWGCLTPSLSEGNSSLMVR